MKKRPASASMWGDQSERARLGRIAALSQENLRQGFGGFPKLGYPFGGPHNKDCSIFGSILGSLYFGKLPFRVEGFEGSPVSVHLRLNAFYPQMKKERTSKLLVFRVAGRA